MDKTAPKVRRSTSGTPPNLCMVATPEELAFIADAGGGHKAKTLHKALALLKDTLSGQVTVTPRPPYLD